jgi:hypothetical protein
VHETAGSIGGGARTRVGLIDLARQSRIDRHVAVGSERDKALCEIDVASGKGGIDFVLRDAAIEGLSQCVVGDGDRIVRYRDPLMRRDAAANKKAGGNCKQGPGQHYAYGMARDTD